MTNRTQAWVWQIAMPRRRRVLFEKRSSHARLADFTLARRNRVETTASQSATEPDLRPIPTGSKPHGCTRWTRGERHRAARSRAFRLMNATLMTAEQDGGEELPARSRLEWTTT